MLIVGRSLLLAAKFCVFRLSGFVGSSAVIVGTDCRSLLLLNVVRQFVGYRLLIVVLSTFIFKLHNACMQAKSTFYALFPSLSK
jgi:hypothetical protein